MGLRRGSAEILRGSPGLKQAEQGCCRDSGHYTLPVWDGKVVLGDTGGRVREVCVALLWQPGLFL